MILKQMSVLHQRLIVGGAGVIVGLIAIYLSPVPAFKPIFTALIALVIALAMREFYAIARLKNLEPVPSLGMLLGTLYVFSIALNTQYDAAAMLPEIVLLTSLLSCFLYYFVYQKSPFINLSTMIFSFAYLVVPLSCIISIAYFFDGKGLEDNRWWLFYLFAVTKMTDTGGLFFGKKFGKQKLAPTISPKKTWEGALGGFFSAVMMSCLTLAIADIFDNGAFSLTFLQSFFLGASIGIVAQFGDLAESLLKRDGGIKDSSHLPGLGGILDIVDSLIFTAPLVYIFLKIQ